MGALHGMATCTDAETAWATFAGKATATSPDGSTVGNQEFVVRTTDVTDSFWVEVLEKQGNAGACSLDGPRERRSAGQGAGADEWQRGSSESQAKKK